MGQHEADSILALVEELCRVRERSVHQVEGDRLFVFVQSCFRSLDGKVTRITSDFVLPGGTLLTTVGKITCPVLKGALAELGGYKDPPMVLPMYSNKKVLSFLNDDACRKPPKRPLLFR